MRFLLIITILFSSWSISANAQTIPDPFRTEDATEVYTLLRIDIEGVEDTGTRNVLARASGLRVGQAVRLPGDPVFSAAIRAIYRLDQFDQVSISHKKGDDRTVFVTIQVEERPAIESIQITGVKKKDERALQRRLYLSPGSRLRDADVERARLSIKEYVVDKGFGSADVSVTQEVLEDKKIKLRFDVESGPLLAVQSIRITGADQVSDRALRKKMSTTEAKGIKFWDKARFDEEQWQTDLESVLAYLHEKGFYDARILHDSVYVQDFNGKPGLVAEISIHEGRPYFIRNIEWDGNIRFTDAQLTEWLDVVPSARYNRKKLEERLYGNIAGTDISSRYMNEGFMRFQVKPTIVVTSDDSLDVHFDVFEGGQYDFGQIEVVGNLMTKDHVVRRELFSIPGKSFSRSAIQESIRRLVQTGYFGEASLMNGPEISVDDERKKVDLTYRVEETSVPKPRLTGTVGQFGLVLGVGLTYNNFSLQNAFKRGGWRPLPSGDGQTIGLNVQANGKAYQQYGFNFTEPWFRGKPAPIGFSLSYTHIDGEAVSSDLTGRFNTFSASLFHERRLNWPSPNFSAGTALTYQTFDNTVYEELPTGANRQISVTQSISHNTTDHPVFPTRGSKTGLSLEVALPFDGFIQYHKWRLQSSWNLPLTKKGRLSFNITGDLGYIGSITSKPVAFERFVLGGSPLDAQGISTTPILGTDVVYFRGYPLGAFGTGDTESITGGRLLNKYSAELRWSAVKNPIVQATPYLFFDMANTWNGLNQYNPFNLFRSAGAGIRMNVPMLGLLEVVYGRNLDTYGTDGHPKWGLQFSIGRSFNF